jgi:acetylornithine/succinyldiaminopimelate/putrescine aminotransferase
MQARPSIADTCARIVREQLPNLFRLYLNPYVAQTCFCLEKYVQGTWKREEPFQTFLANGFDEALSGAIKLARYSASSDGRPTTGLVLDGGGRLGPFASAAVAGGRIEFVPGLVILGKGDSLPRTFPSPPGREGQKREAGPFGFVVLVAPADGVPEEYAEVIRILVARDGLLVIACVERGSLAALRRDPSGILAEVVPDIVVFDESFVNHDVPFSVFVARKTLYDCWNRPGKTTFHSTTFQPNTISSLHFMRCLEQADPAFVADHASELERIHSDREFRREVFRRCYSPALYDAIRRTGFETEDVRAAGDFVFAGGRRVFDGVSGVACSVRGHNPSAYPEELAKLEGSVDCRAEVVARLRDLTGLECVLPAVSGATAVENALKIALVAQFPKRHVLALKAGFGGKTLFALTGTWNTSYKEHLDPLYADVLYVDPFAADATTQIEAILEKYPVAVVLVELIQAVGGVRLVPEGVISYLEERREHKGYLLLVDEVQTGMYRTGPFALSRARGLSPDLLAVGKGVSDMMFPFALVMYSSAVREKLEQVGSDLPAVFEKRYGYEFGYRTVLNVLRRAEELCLPERIAETGALFTQLLPEKGSCKAVREVRVYGLLLGIELDASRGLRRLFRKQLFWFYLFNMLRHRRYPVLVGFCQYEPNVLKITPALTVAPAEVREVCATITDVLRRPFYRLVATVFGNLLRSLGLWRRKHEHINVPAHEPAQG